MRYFTLITVVLALAIWSDGAPKFARRRRATDYILYNRDTAFVNQQQLQGREAGLAPQARLDSHEAAGSRVVFPASNDYEDHYDHIVTGANSLEGLILGDFVPGLIYSGQPQAAPAPAARVQDEGAVGQEPTASSLQQHSNPASRCILCEPGSCPVCYQLDQNGVCRRIYACEV